MCTYADVCQYLFSKIAICCVLGLLGGLLEHRGAVLGLVGRLSASFARHVGHLYMDIAEVSKNATPPARNAHLGREDEADMGRTWAKLGGAGLNFSPSGVMRRITGHPSFI